MDVHVDAYSHCRDGLSCRNWSATQDSHSFATVTFSAPSPALFRAARNEREKLEEDLAVARRRLADTPDDPDAIIWVGRRLGYLWRINEAIEIFTDGIRKHPDCAALYRHRGHRYISTRRFDDAIRDLETAARLIENRPDEIEQDGAPNSRNIPLTSTGFNVWYHLGVARYLKTDYESALAAFRECLKFTRGFDDNVVAVTDWSYMALRRLGRDKEAVQALEVIRSDMEMIENVSYHRRCLLYKGLIKPDELVDTAKASDLEVATTGYGLGNWYLMNGDVRRAKEIFERVVNGPYWPAFGFIAAENDLVRLRSLSPAIAP
jgi:tetratricopeptide (TPR) repeat protein